MSRSSVSSSPRLIDRRGLLRMLAVGGAASVAPWLTPLERPARAAGGAPKRLLIVYTSHGAGGANWQPSGSETSWTLGSLHQSLAPYKDKLLMAAGLDFRSCDYAAPTQACGHMYGMVHSLTNGGQDGDVKMALNPSFDQIIVQKFKEKNGGTHPTPQPYLMMGIGQENFIYQQPFFSGRSSPLPIDMDPGNVFTNKLLPSIGNAGSGSTAPSAADAIALDRRKLALDYVGEEIKWLRARLGSAERDRLDQIAANVSDLSKTVGGQGTKTPMLSCQKPTAPAGGRGGWTNTTTNVPKAIQTAFACDVTRVIGVVVNQSPDNVVGFSGQAGMPTLHELIHQTQDGGSARNDGGALAVNKAFYKNMADVFASLIAPLANTKEADGSSVLDNTIALWASEISEGGHGTDNNKWIVAGSGGGKLKTGLNVTFGDRNRGQFSEDKSQPSSADFLLTLAQALDVNLTTFGDGRAVKGPITRLLNA